MAGRLHPLKTCLELDLFEAFSAPTSPSTSHSSFTPYDSDDSPPTTPEGSQSESDSGNEECPTFFTPPSTPLDFSISEKTELNVGYRELVDLTPFGVTDGILERNNCLRDGDSSKKGGGCQHSKAHAIVDLADEILERQESPQSPLTSMNFVEPENDLISKT
ncbi:hypothetical protein AAF712_008107 [Marasmius tenuissimus]|uniref:Uncharacterized protein n=1 Tax=Marasmius tenuissimus TaxID=585030 RepID=A0ABR2ZTH6_9AGAR|nr:hypothetical protein PM082_009905 [Marasmius tenuissimus]